MITRGMNQLFVRELLVLARRTARTLRNTATTPAKRLRLCKQVLNSEARDARLYEFVNQTSRLAMEERHYWIGTFYAMLLPATERRTKATYFTPPYLAQSIVALACEH